MKYQMDTPRVIEQVIARMIARVAAWRPVPGTVVGVNPADARLAEDGAERWARRAGDQIPRRRLLRATRW